MGPRGRAIFAVVVWSGLGGIAALGAACITPPPEWVNPPPTRPIILDDQVHPALDQFLQPPLASFVISVQLADSQDVFQFSEFLDYDKVANHGLFTFGTITPNTTKPIVTIDPPTIPLDGKCHRVEIIVAHDFARLLDGTVLYHTPDPNVGGDQVGWFVAQAGNPSSCLGFDAGLRPEDASPEGATSDGPTPEGALPEAATSP